MELLKKLRLNVDEPLWLINCPTDCEDIFDDFTINVKLGKEKPASQLMLFVTSMQEMATYMVKLEPYIAHKTVCWIAYPKKSGDISSDLVHMKNWEVVFSRGYRGQTSVSINDNWSSLRITNAPPKKPSTYGLPAGERNIEGIDFVNRTVRLPHDALSQVKKHKGLEAYFNSLAFTHKKEHVIAILEAKKPETRLRRIEKMIEMLQQKIQAKK